MSFLALANSRYTTKSYNPNGKISDQHIEQLKSIIRMSPSSINSQPWKFVFVSDESVKSKLAAASYFNEQKVNQASHLVVFYAIDDVELFESQIRGFLPQGAFDYYQKMIKPNGEAAIKAWMQHQVYLSLGFFLAGCASLGIDSTPMEGIDVVQYNEILKMGGYKPLFAVALGYRDPQDTNQPAVKPKFRLPAERVVETV